MTRVICAMCYLLVLLTEREQISDRAFSNSKLSSNRDVGITTVLQLFDLVDLLLTLRQHDIGELLSIL